MTVTLQITLYSKPDCHLCTQLQEDLAWLRRDLADIGPFDVQVVDITTDAQLHEQFRLFIPVLDIGGALIYPPHELLTLRRQLLAALRSQPAA